MNTIEKAEKELTGGNLWRAKEILQSATRSSGYNVEIFEKLGNVFLRMGDRPEAGRFLFLSGVRKPEYKESIDLFLSKYGKNGPKDFFHLIPRKARLKNLSDYPDEVAHKLRELGLPESFKPTPRYTARDAESAGTLFWITCVTIALVVLVLIMLGASKAIEMIRQAAS